MKRFEPTNPFNPSKTTKPVISFSSNTTPDAKIAPIVIGGAAFVGKAIIGGALGTAASWGTTRYLDNHFPSRR
jgi:hypothetical protein